MRPHIKRITRIGLAVVLMLSCATFGRVANAASNEAKAIVIKFRDSAFGNTNSYKVTGAVTERIKEIAPNAKLRPMINPKPFAELQKVAQERGFAKDLKTADIPVRNYFALEGKFPDLTNVVADLKNVPQIETAYPAPEVSNPSLPTPPAGDLFKYQFHLYDAPRGVGAMSAWKLAPLGACGAGMHVVDLEMGWSLTHAAYNRHNPTKLGGDIVDEWKGHGTRVLGVICAKDNGNILGVAPHVRSVKVIAHNGSSESIGDAIVDAARELLQRQPRKIGGVLVIEAQLHRDGAYKPVEIEEYIYPTILAATGAGVVVIEAAGNGNSNLDDIPKLNRCLGTSSTSPFLDSGAIMVSGGTITDVGGKAVWQRWTESNYGSRIDCFAEGGDVRTADFPNDTAYCEIFNGTSSATAIIAGVALSAQGIRKQKHGVALDGVRLRTVLTNVLNGTMSMGGPAPSCTPGVGKWIGVMPDLVTIQPRL